MNMDKGFIMLPRRYMDHWLYTGTPFCRPMAYLDLMLLAKYKDGVFISQGSTIEGKRGTVYISMLELSKRWGWGREKVKRFLSELEKDGLVETEISKYRTTITLVEYDDFQKAPTTDATTDTTTHTTTNATTHTTTDATTHRQPTEQRIDTSNKDNNVNKVNNGEESKEGEEGCTSESKSPRDPYHTVPDQLVCPEMYIDPSEYEWFEYADELKEDLWRSKLPHDDPRYQSAEELVECIRWFNGELEAAKARGDRVVE